MLPELCIRNLLVLHSIRVLLTLLVNGGSGGIQCSSEENSGLCQFSDAFLLAPALTKLYVYAVFIGEIVLLVSTVKLSLIDCLW